MYWEGEIQYVNSSDHIKQFLPFATIEKMHSINGKDMYYENGCIALKMKPQLCFFLKKNSLSIVRIRMCRRGLNFGIYSYQ